MTDQLQATLDVTAAFQRLVDAGLATDQPDRGINRQGLDTLQDLLAVLIFQAGAGGQSAEPTSQVASVTARAMLSALGDLLAGERPVDGHTLQLLTAAVRTSRA